MSTDSFLLEVLRKTNDALVRTDIVKKIPGTSTAYYSLRDFLFQHFWPYQNVIEIQGSKMYVDVHYESLGMRRTFQAYAFSRIHEPSTTRLFKEVVKQGDFVVDLGANIGYFTLLAAKLMGKKGKAYAFEPEPTNFGFLTKNIKLNGYNNIVANQKAVSDRQGKVRLYINPEDTGHHTIKQYEGKSDDGRRFVEVDMIPLDDFFKGERHPIDVVKMDIEGAEMLALSGMDRVINENKNLKMFVEFYPTIIREMGSSPEEFACELLEHYHFSMFVISDDYWGLKEKSIKIGSVDELVNICKGEQAHVNLFLEKGDKVFEKLFI